ncbi:putative plasma membrane h+-atpase pma1 protein [Phaeoacremonium minimum UCRPA7]|uniref:Plasma membrane ATPase n=1 Tax=Phaeoacremonium minimum (strain UCR-PA7) TaxID=1286976 RepID=R8BFM2_PHAM7|nr:putative plasma membrane h+-atpase pma1 protein [Phaeoacremonium minimum UCRPA7]EON98106.1 putative plasma membrane h+-atpase pma1 protein [Phaeoacremonium minimum UCRPA7]
MAPNFKKVMAFGKHRSFQAPMPLNTEEPEHDLESGNFLSETQRTDAPIADPKPPGGDNPYLDEYRALTRYIDTYRDANAETEGEEEFVEQKKGPWWKFGAGKAVKASLSDFVTPTDWLNTDIRDGLDAMEVERRRKRSGWNELSAEKENMFLKFVGFFQGPILYVMEAAAILAFGLRDWVDAGVICAILLLNAIVGWYQEKQAADVVASLKGDISMKARVIRNGSEQEIKARELVPGDIIIIEEGHVVAADARLICEYETGLEGFNQYRAELLAQDVTSPRNEKFEEDGEDGVPHIGHAIVAIDQSAITGESLAVDKYMTDTVYYTTGCKRGKAYAIVTHGAQASFVGKTASLVQGAKDQGHFKAIMNSIGTSLLVLVVLFMLAAWIGGFYRHLKIATPEDSSVNLLHYALILLIIGVPVGLPVVTTTTLAVGAAYLAKEKAIVQKLTAIESLAGVDILCSDKTGTLTANQLSVREPFVMEGVDINWMMAVAALASSHNIKALDPIDKITILTLKRYPKAKEMIAEGWKTEKFIPFDPVSKRITSVCTFQGVRYECCKGAPKAVLAISNCTEEQAALFKEKATEFARRGFRSLAVAVREDNGPWQLLGMLSLFDPPRSDTAQTIAEAQALGLQVKMLTGDAIAIAKETCRMLALGTKVYNSDKLLHSDMAGSAIHDLCERADGFAEVFPEHKYQVVEMLQQRGHLTAMTGDGVNDAPSLKKSDCGIAVEGATEAAQAAADIVFLAPGLSTIVSAIKISRQIFQRMKAYIQYRIALCLHLELYLVTSMIIINETIRVDLIVFLALFADLATIAVAYDNAHYERRPVEWQLPKIWIISIVLGFLLAIGTWVLRGTLWLPNGGIIQNYGSIQGMLFLQVSLTENWLIFVTRGFNTFPSWQLIGAIFGVDALATLFCVFGWFTGGAGEPSSPASIADKLSKNGRTDIVTIVVIWCYSIAVCIVIAIVYHIMTNMQSLNDLGRKKRSAQDTIMENIMTHLSKVAIEHEHDDKGANRYYLATKQVVEEED